MKEDNKRKQIYAQKILQDIEDKKNRDVISCFIYLLKIYSYLLLN